MQRSTFNIGESKHTSVKVHHAPGGKSNFSLGWGSQDHQSQQHKKRAPVKTQNPNVMSGNYRRKDAFTSVKVQYAPGGKSSFSLWGDKEAEQKKNQPVQKENKDEEEEEKVKEVTHGFKKGQHHGFSQIIMLTLLGMGNEVKHVVVKQPPGGKSSFSLY